MAEVNNGLKARIIQVRGQRHGEPQNRETYIHTTIEYGEKKRDDIRGCENKKGSSLHMSVLRVLVPVLEPITVTCTNDVKSSLCPIKLQKS